MAAVLACGPGALLSHISAAALHGLLSSARELIDVTILREVGRSRPGICIHRSTHFAPADSTLTKGIPCTSVARTLLDVAGIVHRRVLERACDQAEVSGLIDWSALDDVLSRAHGRRGVRNLRAVLGPELGGEIPSSELERRFLALCRRAGLPRPAVNDWVAIPGEEMQVDFVWHGPRVIVETDGFRTHGTRQAFQRDRRRDRLLSIAGWQVARFTWYEVTNEPMQVTQHVRKLFAGREASSRA